MPSLQPGPQPILDATVPTAGTWYQGPRPAHTAVSSAPPVIGWCLLPSLCPHGCVIFTPLIFFRWGFLMEEVSTGTILGFLAGELGACCSADWFENLL